MRASTEIAAAEGMDLGRVSRIVRLTRLAPVIVEACLTGKENGLTLEIINRRGVPAEWGVQRLKLLISRECRLTRMIGHRMGWDVSPAQGGKTSSRTKKP